MAGATFTRRLSSLVTEDGFGLGLTDIDYPIFDELYRPELNNKIIKHYWNYEIGQETESMFRFAFNRKMNEIMPYYNQLYLSTRIMFDPLQTVNYTDFTNITQTNSGDKSDSSNTTGTGNSKARNVQSETPQVLLSPNEDYASSAADTIAQSDTTNAATATGSHSDTSSGSVEKTIQGSQGPSAAELLMRYRATFLNIDMDVIKELESLFMLLWDNGDEYTRGIGLDYGLTTNYFGIL